MGAENKNENLDEDINKKDDTTTKETGSESKTTETKSDKTDTTKVTDKSFTQEQLTTMMTKEKNQGRAAALKELGIDPKDTKAIALVKSLIDGQKTDEQKVSEKAAEDNKKVEEANQRAMTAEAKAEAMVLGVKPQFVEDVVALAMSKMTENSDLKTIIGEFKTKYAIWFGTSDDKNDEKKAGQKGTGSSVKSNEKQKGSEEKGLGARLAAQRKTGAKKTSYWS